MRRCWQKPRAKAALRLVGEAGILRDPKIGPYFQFRSGHALGHSYEDPIGSPEFPQPYDTPPPLPEGLLLPEKGMMFARFTPISSLKILPALQSATWSW